MHLPIDEKNIKEVCIKFVQNSIADLFCRRITRDEKSVFPYNSDNRRQWVLRRFTNVMTKLFWSEGYVMCLVESGVHCSRLNREKKDELNGIEVWLYPTCNSYIASKGYGLIHSIPEWSET